MEQRVASDALANNVKHVLTVLPGAASEAVKNVSKASIPEYFCPRKKVASKPALT